MADLRVLISLVGEDHASKAIQGVTNDLHGLDKAAGAVGGTLATVGTVAAGAAVAGVAALGAGLAASVSKATEFEKQMSAVKAVMAPADVAEFGARLEDLALTLGSKTAFTAKEAAAGLEELTKAGIPARAILEGAGEAALNLASAGGVPVKEAAEIAANAMNNFGISGDKMAHVADIIAGAVNTSAIGMNDFKFSMSAVGPVADLTGQSFEQTATAIALMGNAGIKGSDAGTSLKTMLNNLIPTTDKAVTAFQNWGIITTDETRLMQVMTEKGMDFSNMAAGDMIRALAASELGITDWNKVTKKQQTAIDEMLTQMGVMKNAFIDEHGQFEDLSKIAGVLNQAFKDATEAEKSLALETMFGSDAIRAAAILTKAGAEGFDELAASINQITAAEVAETRLDNLAGSMEKFSGAVDTAMVKVGREFTPALKELLDAFTPLIEEAMPAIEQAAKDVATVFREQVIPQIKAFVAWIKDHQAEIQGFAGVVRAVFDTIGQALDGVLQGFAKFVFGARQFVADVGGVFDALGTTIRTAFDGITQFFGETVGTWATAAATLGTSIVEGIKKGIGDQWAAMTGWFGDQLKGLLGGGARAIEAQSPSQLALRIIGTPIAEGIQGGIEEGLIAVNTILNEGLAAMIAESHAQIAAANEQAVMDARAALGTVTQAMTEARRALSGAGGVAYAGGGLAGVGAAAGGNAPATTLPGRAPPEGAAAGSGMRGFATGAYPGSGLEAWKMSVPALSYAEIYANSFPYNVPTNTSLFSRAVGPQTAGPSGPSYWTPPWQLAAPEQAAFYAAHPELAHLQGPAQPASTFPAHLPTSSINPMSGLPWWEHQAGSQPQPVIVGTINLNGVSPEEFAQRLADDLYRASLQAGLA